jgi:hydrogenase nickel incorporation protein HypA/HybF
MHELSIAQSILDIVHEYVSESDRHRVRNVFVTIGALSGVVPDSLDFSFTAITAETPLQNAKLQIMHVPFTIQCNTCNAVSEQEAGLVLCPRCNGFDTRTLTGTELQVTEIEVDDPTGS